MSNTRYCSLAPPEKNSLYCVPAPFQSVDNESYFLLKEAYGGLPNNLSNSQKIEKLEYYPQKKTFPFRQDYKKIK